MGSRSVGWNKAVHLMVNKKQGKKEARGVGTPRPTRPHLLYLSPPNNVIKL